MGSARIAGALALAAVAIQACDEGDSGPAGPTGPVSFTPRMLTEFETAPELIVMVTAVFGASGPGGNFRPGDRIGVRFTLTKEDATDWFLPEMDEGVALVSGPTFNYQRVLALRDVRADMQENADGSFTYVFEPLPLTYLPPLNDSPTFGADAGELTGQPLLDGTYTLGLSFVWNYTVVGVGFRQVGEITVDLLQGPGAGPSTPREVTAEQNCNQCHVDLQAHEGRYTELVMCLMCHTAGAEDLNDPAIEGGTPDITVDARVLFHKLHSGSRLPSVLGVATNANGTRNYAATPRPYRVVGDDGTVNDYSDVGWPVMPNRTLPMPRDVGYAGLTAAEQELEDTIRRGVSTCFVCHGDPDGAGPLGPPAQGDLVFSQMTRRTCGACHDDVDFTLPYFANLGVMPPQLNDASCTDCHNPAVFPNPLAPNQAHIHPLKDPGYTSGLVFDVLAVDEAGTADGDGTIDPGEKVLVTFTIADDAGLPVDVATLDTVRAIVSGPTSNLQILLEIEVPQVLLTGPQPYRILLPETRIEFVGDATAAPGETFQTALAPHTVASATKVSVRTATAGGSSVLAAAASRRQNFLDVADAAGFARKTFVVVDDGVPGLEEYFEIQLVDGNRIWFSSPDNPDYLHGLSADHAAGATVREVVLTTLAVGVDYTLDPSTGEISELVEFGAGNAVIVVYTTDFVVPGDYPHALDASPDRDETHGDWTGKSLVDGTYTVGITGHTTVIAFAFGQLTTYPLSGRPGTRDFLAGSALNLEPYGLVSSPQNCNACHKDLTFHDGFDRGFGECILCHGTAGAEDRPRYVAANAPETSGVTINFRTLLHQIHRGRQLANPTFTVVGSGPDPYPDNFRAKTFETFSFPAQPGATQQCGQCHGGANTAALFPSDRNHPLEQLNPVLAWRAACSACHDSVASIAHMDVQTSPAGVEACSMCHGPGQIEDVLVVHQVR